jgi:microcystin synthetase protein McyG
LPDAELLYDVAWRSQPSVPQDAAADFWPPPSDLAAPLRTLLSRIAADHADSAYCEALLHLEALSVHYVAAAWEHLGWRFTPGTRGLAAELPALLGVADRHRRLLHRMAEMLAEAGLLRRDGAHWIGTTHFNAAPTGAEIALLLARAPAAVAECTLLDRCGQRLADILRGRQEVLPLLFPDGDAIAASSLYCDAPGARLMNRVMAEAVALACRHLPPGRLLRVLEVGGGTGGTTADLLRVLPPDRTDYVFTDISPRFTMQAEARFSGHGFLRAQVLDLERDPQDQGFPETARFDLIVAANVLHATRDLRQSLRHLQRLAAPGATLLLLEGTEPIRAVDLVFGLTDGWWRFADDRVAAAYPLVSAATWTSLLAERGFADAEAVTLPREPWGLLARQAVILARATGAAAPQALPAARHLLILADHGGIGRRLADHHAASGGTFTLVEPMTGPDGLSSAPFRRRLADLDPSLPLEVVYLGGLDALPLDVSLPDALSLAGMPEADAMSEGRAMPEAGADDGARIACNGVLGLVQALADDGPRPPISHTWLVTRGATGEGPLPGLAQATLWGLGRVVAQEHPDLRPVRIDLDPAQSADANARALWDELRTASPEDERRLREGTRQVPRLVRCADAAPPAGPRFSGDATYLITGGLGGLGLLTARWLAERGAGTLLLAGRHAPDAPAAAAFGAIEALGARIVPYQADIAQPQEVERLLRHAAASLPPLRGIVHTAGVLDDGMLRHLTWDRFADVLRPKVAGAWNLHRATMGQALDFFVLYSSFTAILGTPGQASHAAANAFLDALAWHRRASGLPALSLGWGAWAEIGAAARRHVGDRLAAQGGATIAPAQGLRLLARSWHAAAPQRAIVPIHWQHVAAEQLARPLLAELVPTTPASAVAPPDLRARLRAVAPGRRHGLLVEHVAAEAAKVLGLKASDAIGGAQGFFELGMDSLTSVELRNRLRAALGCDLPATLAFDHPTPDVLADFLLARLADPPAASAQNAPKPDALEPDAPTPDAADLAALSVAELDILIDQIAGAP